MFSFTILSCPSNKGQTSLCLGGGTADHLAASPLDTELSVSPQRLERASTLGCGFSLWKQMRQKARFFGARSVLLVSARDETPVLLSLG